MRIRLHAQPFQVLLMLLARPGELVTREEIAQELWPGDTFVDSEHGVNSAVNRIREALGDTARSPRFVETLPRRGYRFLVPVERVSAEPAATATATATATAELEAAEPQIVEPSAAQPAGPGPPMPTPEEQASGGWLAASQELPEMSAPAVVWLFVLLQILYLSFYVGALGNLGEIEDLFAVLPSASVLLRVTVATAAVGIPVRAYAIAAALLKPPGGREKLLRLWWFLLFLDELWALSPFLLLHHINFGLALACTALLVYAPFAQRSLVLMGAGSRRLQSSQ